MNKGFALNVYSATDAPVIEANDFFAESRVKIVVMAGTDCGNTEVESPGTGKLAQDPVFIDASADRPDFPLPTSSLMIDSG